MVLVDVVCPLPPLWGGRRVAGDGRGGVRDIPGAGWDIGAVRTGVRVAGRGTRRVVTGAVLAVPGIPAATGGDERTPTSTRRRAGPGLRLSALSSAMCGDVGRRSPWRRGYSLVPISPSRR